MQSIAKFFLRLFGWTLVYEEPPYKKFVLIFAPHTSNWDFPIGMLAIFAAGIKLRWFAKKSLFVWPLGPLMKLLGGIRIDRTQTRDTVDYFAAGFAEHSRFVLGMSPEGSRSYTEHWKSGFYNIAKKANAPIALALFDYNEKKVGIGDFIELSDSIDKDMDKIRMFYASVTARHPDKFGPVRLKSENDSIPSLKS